MTDTMIDLSMRFTDYRKERKVKGLYFRSLISIFINLI